MTINLRTRQGWDDLKHLLDERTGEVLRRLGLPEPRKAGWTVLDDPRGDGRGCFGLCLRGDGLSWKKFNGDASGRLLELIAYVNGWYHLDRRGAAQAANWAIDAFGLGRISPEQLARDRANAQARQAQARAAEDEALRRRQGRAYYTFVREAVPILGLHGEGTGAEIYLRDKRGIDLRAEPFRGPRNGLIAPASLRFIARHRYIHRDRQGRKYRETFHPALLACCVDADMKIRAIHQTYLKDDFSDKVELPPAPDGAPQKPRKIWPDYAGCVIPLWRGEGHFSPREAAENGLLQTFVFTEGVEDGLSAVLAGPQFRVWAMLSLSNMVNVAQRLPVCCDSAIIHRQNDWQKPQAVAAFDAGMAAFRAAGRAVSEVAATTGKDLNDTLRGAA